MSGARRVSAAGKGEEETDTERHSWARQRWASYQGAAGEVGQAGSEASSSKEGCGQGQGRGAAGGGGRSPHPNGHMRGTAILPSRALWGPALTSFPWQGALGVHRNQRPWAVHALTTLTGGALFARRLRGWGEDPGAREDAASPLRPGPGLGPCRVGWGAIKGCRGCRGTAVLACLQALPRPALLRSLSGHLPALLPADTQRRRRRIFQTSLSAGARLP